MKKKSRSEQIDEAIDLFKKVAVDPESISRAEKRQMKKLIYGDEELFMEAFNTFREQCPDFISGISPSGSCDDSRTDEEIIADNYVALARFAIEKMQLKNVQKLKVKESDCGFIVYALTPDPVELNLNKFATSDYPDNKELLLEAEALQADLFMEDGAEEYRREIIDRIERTAI